jgi:hypothetical protein
MTCYNTEGINYGQDGQNHITQRGDRKRSFAKMISAITRNSFLSIPGRPPGNDEIVIQIEALTELSLLSEKPGHIANRGKQVYCSRLSVDFLWI